jgi:hypothetical protein
VLQSWLPPAAMAEYGWRLAFVFGGVLGLVSVWLRREPAVSATMPMPASTARRWWRSTSPTGLRAAACWRRRSWLPPAAMAEYGWRLAFVFGGVLGLVSVWLRRALEETVDQREHDPAGEARPVPRGLDHEGDRAGQLAADAQCSSCRPAPSAWG